MNLFLTKERRFQRDSDGTIYTDNASASGYAFFKRYLDVFDSVTIIGRLQEKLTTGNTPVTGPQVHFLPVPHYLGPTEYFCKALAIDRVFADIVGNNRQHSAFIARCPGNLGSLLIDKLCRIGHPFGMEVVGDPYDVFAPGAIRHPLRPVFRSWFSRRLRWQCRQACAVSYVTEYSLQRRYPPAGEAFTTHYSSIQLERGDFIDAPRQPWTGGRPLELICVGTLAQLYKAQDILIRAVGVCLDQGLDLRLTLVGDGQFRPDLEALARTLGLGERVRFLGQLRSGAPVRAALDAADLFVLPSKGEGLPRAMIEAMARGLPCIGTAASGIPELLPAEDLVPPGEVPSLAAKIMEVAASPLRMATMAERNLNKSQDYLYEILQQRRIAFYREIRQQTEAFQSR